jgi:hypothetical protein
MPPDLFNLVYYCHNILYLNIYALSGSNSQAEMMFIYYFLDLLAGFTLMLPKVCKGWHGLMELSAHSSKGYRLNSLLAQYFLNKSLDVIRILDVGLHPMRVI